MKQMVFDILMLNKQISLHQNIRIIPPISSTVLSEKVFLKKLCVSCAFLAYDDESLSVFSWAGKENGGQKCNADREII